MERAQFRGLLRAFTWLLIILSFFTEIKIFNLDLFWFILPLIFLRIPLVNWLYGPPERQKSKENLYPQKQPQQNDQTGKPYSQMGTSQNNTTNSVCPECGSENFEGASFCERCGFKLENHQPVTSQNDTTSPACPQCGYKTFEGARFCERCGTNFQEHSMNTAKNETNETNETVTTYCSKCGKQNPVGVNFCDECGSNLRESQVNSSSSK